MKVYVIQNKNEIINGGVGLRNQLLAGLAKLAVCQILVQRIMTVIRDAKLTNIQTLKISIRIEDEILNKTETSIDDETAKK